MRGTKHISFTVRMLKKKVSFVCHFAKRNRKFCQHLWLVHVIIENKASVWFPNVDFIFLFFFLFFLRLQTGLLKIPDFTKPAVNVKDATGLKETLLHKETFQVNNPLLLHRLFYFIPIVKSKMVPKCFMYDFWPFEIFNILVICKDAWVLCFYFYLNFIQRRV